MEALKRAIRWVHNMSYVDRCTVYHQSVFHDQNGKQRVVMKPVYTDIPCRLSYGGASTSSSGKLPEADQKIELFMDSKYRIDPGAEIEVKQSTGRRVRYYLGSVPDVYPDHQEVHLVRERKKERITWESLI